MLIPALLVGRKGSTGLPGKNTMKILGRPLMMYPIINAQHSKYITNLFVSTNCEQIEGIAKANGAEIINRPDQLCCADSSLEDVIKHGYEEIVKRIGDVEIFVLLLCNSATITPGILDKAIERLLMCPSADSAVSVSPYNEHSPVRAKRITENGILEPYVDISKIKGASSNRNTTEVAYFCDGSLFVMRPRCLEYARGVLPFRWLGEASLPVVQEGGHDIDHEYQVSITEYWLRKHGYTEIVTPFD